MLLDMPADSGRQTRAGKATAIKAAAAGQQRHSVALAGGASPAVCVTAPPKLPFPSDRLIRAVNGRSRADCPKSPMDHRRPSGRRRAGQLFRPHQPVGRRARNCSMISACSPGGNRPAVQRLLLVLFPVPAARRLAAGPFRHQDRGALGHISLGRGIGGHRPVQRLCRNLRGAPAAGHRRSPRHDRQPESDRLVVSHQ